MAKITVTAAKDFFDRNTHASRQKGKPFTIKESALKSYGKNVVEETKKEVKVPAKKAKK